MSCINADGTLTESALKLLELLERPHTPQEVASQLDRPLYWVRLSLREMVGADLVRTEGERYIASEKGRAKRQETLL